MLRFKGLVSDHKPVLLECLSLLNDSKSDIVDAFLAAQVHQEKCEGVYSFDKKDMSELGIKTLDIK